MSPNRDQSNYISENTTVIVRSVGERTTAACIHLLQQALPQSEIIRIHEIPFSRAVRRCYEIGIERNRKWTLVLDADVLIRTAFIPEALAVAEDQPDHLFIVKGLIFDKFLHVFRPAGNHLYHTRHLARAIDLIPAEGETLRPESTTELRMAELGFSTVQTGIVAGLHDFEQDYIDIAKKNFLQAHKHTPYMALVWPVWQKRAISDVDYHVAMMGAAIGANYKGKVLIDSDFLENQILSAFNKNNLLRKEPLKAGKISESFVSQLLQSALNDPDTTRLQEHIFPEKLWNSVECNDTHRINPTLPVEATRADRSAQGVDGTCSRPLKVLFVAHDCYLAGAQQSLLRILYWLRHNTRWEMGVLALGAGVLQSQYEKLAPLLLADPALLLSTHNPGAALEKIADLTGGLPDAIFGNTVVAANAYSVVGRFGRPIITRVAELESGIERYATPATVKAMLQHSSGFIAVSRAVANMLANRFGVSLERISIINGAIEKINTALDMKRRRQLLAQARCDFATPVLWGCGTINARKGVDLFWATAEMLVQMGCHNFHAFWVGEPEGDLIRRIEKKISNSIAKNHVTFTGSIPQPYLLMAPGDIFLMTSREDPFPLVCLEAAERAVPSICFPNTGGIVDFIQAGGGFVTETLSAESMAHCINQLMPDEDRRLQAGTRARDLVLQHHTMAHAGPRFIKAIEHTASQRLEALQRLAYCLKSQSAVS